MVQLTDKELANEFRQRLQEAADLAAKLTDNGYRVQGTVYGYRTNKSLAQRVQVDIYQQRTVRL